MRWPLALIILAVVLTACGGSSDDSPTATAPSSATATTVPARATLPPFPTRPPRPTSTPVTSYEAGTRTGLEVIDSVVGAIENGDSVALVQLLSFHPYRCDNAPSGTDGSNPCPPGVPEGAAVDVIAVGECDVRFLARARADLQAEVTAFVEALAGQGVYAITEVGSGRLASPLPLRYLLIYSGGQTLLLDDAGVTHLGRPCDGVGPAELYHPADRAILSPL